MSCAAQRRPRGMEQKITTNLWFDTQAEEAANFYISLFDESRIVHVAHYNEAGPREAGMVMVVEFELAGQRFVGINGGPEFTFDEAMSLQINCDSQDEIDYFWEKLTEGGQEGPCGWLKDKFGLSWQIIPSVLGQLLTDSKSGDSAAAMQAMLKMKKLDIAQLQHAYRGR
jgi:predicted 3-demethylubiquinone-9 3-methyltransferase (glyoxalase superfamily)